MYAKNQYCVQVRSKKGWRYYSKYTALETAHSTYTKALQKYNQVRMVNATEFGVRVANII